RMYPGGPGRGIFGTRSAYNRLCPGCGRRLARWRSTPRNLRIAYLEENSPMRRSISHIFLGVLAAPLMLLSSKAFAAGEACNNFQAVAEGRCKVEVEGGCEADCTPLNFTAACDGQCSASASVDCTGGCEVDCEASCDVNPGGFDCEGSCTAGCETDCST